MRRPEVARYALVLWANEQGWILERMRLAQVPMAVEHGAVVLAREDDILSEVMPAPAMDMTLLSGSQRRRDHRVGPDEATKRKEGRWS